MNNKESKIILEEQFKDFIFQKNKSNLNISFNRIAFIFFVFFIAVKMEEILEVKIFPTNQ